MSDRELGLQNELDDGETWAEAGLRHPKLDALCICYATHVVGTHHCFSIPDMLRMDLDHFDCEIKVCRELDFGI